MASKLGKTNVVQIAKRSFAAQPATKALFSPDIQSGTSYNKVKVVSVNETSPIARISVAFKAGARYETPDNLGITHVLRSAAGLSTEEFTHFGIIRHVQQAGGSLYATVDREGIVYTIEAVRKEIGHVHKFLASVVGKTEFRPWEVSDLTPRLKYDRLTRPSQVSELRLQIVFFFLAFLTIRLADSIAFKSGGGSGAAASKFYGGELRKASSEPLAYVAVATESASASAKEALAFAVLKYALGAGPARRRRLYLPLLSAFNVNYADSGLFGFVLAASPDKITPALQASIDVVRGAGIKDADIARGKALLKRHLADSFETLDSTVDSVVRQAVTTGVVKSLPDLLAEVEAVSSSDVSAAAGKIKSGKVASAAFGSLQKLPYIDTLLK
ncbi:cytochrome b-c1 complex subunit 2, mitochondrial [Diaphorina citri]|uniref:Cytochrome b-c1 complex subunit 2, mitochondrial n=1 Tax=Diaphorina citri TaxID=121845 RepID=A0A3Q0J125_DIACI|nr:cytochrome b-c1 complex subunit 2, mitochondrial [Diaphorina citri]